jgi:hypothetical protein
MQQIRSRCQRTGFRHRQKRAQLFEGDGIKAHFQFFLIMVHIF